MGEKSKQGVWWPRVRQEEKIVPVEDEGVGEEEKMTGRRRLETRTEMIGESED